MARNAPDPIPPSLKRKIEEIYERADALPDESPEGVIVCPPSKHRKLVHVMVAILEAPSVQLRLPRHGQPAPTATLHAINAHPGGGTYLWQPVPQTPGGVVAHGVANLAAHDVTAVARGSMEVEVVYTVPEGVASARCRIDVVAPVVRPGDALDFGSVPRVHPATPSADREVRIANVGDADLTLDGLALAGDHAGDFEITRRPDDGTVVGARQDVAVRIRLSPTASGLRSARLVIASDDPASPQVAVPLRGRGTAPRIVLEPVEAFGETRLGEIGVKLLTIRNADDADADLVLTGFRAQSDVFLLDHSATQGTLAPGQSTRVRVGYRPSAEGEQRSAVEVDSNDPATPTASTPVVGIGIRPRLEVSPLEGFGGVTVGKRRREPQRLVLANRGRAPLVVGPFALEGEHAEEFAPAEDALGQRTLSPDETCVLALPFAPRDRGERVATIRFGSNDPDQPEVTVPLEGVGLRPRLEIVRVDPIADFLFGVLGTTTVIVTNTGDEGSELDVTDVGLGERDHARFAVERTLVGQTLAKGETKTFQIALDAPDQGTFETTLGIRSNDPVTPVATAPVTGRCRRPILSVGTVAPFQTVAIGEGDPRDRTLTIANTGDAPLTVTSVTVPPGVFRLSSEHRGTVIDGPGSIDVTVSATPTSSTAIHQATITVATSAGNATAAVEASAYALPAFAARTSPIAPDVDDADLHYTIEDPKGAVGRATITVHEIVRPGNTLGRVIATFDGLPHASGDNAFAWTGAVTHADYSHGFVMRRGIAYRLKLAIARADGNGPLERTCDVAIKDVGELLVTILRHDGAALAGRATIHLTNQTTLATTVHTTVAKTGPDREELLVKGLSPARYEVQVQNLGTYLGTEGLGRIGPDHAGRANVAVKLGERASTTFELTRYTQVQLIGFYATPTGTNRSLLTPAVQATYLGEPDDRQDMLARCEIMKKAMADAQAHARTDATNTVLKVLMAPEFYFRGQGGGYPIEIVEEILPELLEEAKKPEYADWVFVYGTTIGYHKHGDGAPDEYELRIITDLGGAPQRLRIVADTLLTRDRQSSVAVCGRIRAGNSIPVDWKLRQGMTVASIWSATPISPTEYEIELLMGQPTINVGAVTLVEPLSTEVFNIAFVQRGGPSPGGKRDRLVYKDYVSSIDFLGLHHPATNADFYAGVATHLADIHHTGERLIVPTMGSIDGFSQDRNPSVTGGTSEYDKSGLGGGGLFMMGGVNFGMEVCLDHLEQRLTKYLAGATSGDPRPQVHLIPSWGMSIAQGPIYTVANGLVLNVDGRVGHPPEAGTFNGDYRCPDHAHNGVAHGPPSPGNCPQPHFKCGAGHRHFEAAANCSRCGSALTPVYTCLVSPHYDLAPTCTECGATGLPLAGYWCTTHNAVGASPCPICGGAAPPFYACNAPSHLVTTAMHCGVATTAYPRGICPAFHDHTEHAPGNCCQCGTALTPETRKLENDWTPLAATAAGVAVPDPLALYAVDEGTVWTVTRVTVNATGDLQSETSTVAPPGTPPLAIPATPANTDVTTNPAPNVVRRVRTWTTGPLTLTSTEEQTTVADLLTTTVTTVVTTRRTGNVAGAWAQLFATQGTLYIYPPTNVPQAQTVP